MNHLIRCEIRQEILNNGINYHDGNNRFKSLINYLNVAEIQQEILNNGVNFDEFNARIKAHKVHNKHETAFLKNKTNKFIEKSSKFNKNYNNKPARKLHDRRLRW